MRMSGVILPQPRGSGRIVPLMPLTEGADNELGLPWMIPGLRAAKNTKKHMGMPSTKKVVKERKGRYEASPPAYLGMTKA